MKRQTLEMKAARERLLNDISKTQEALDVTYAHLATVSDPDLIDSYIYELNSIHYRYKYLIRQAKECRLTRQF